jgi:hypothetical protein
MEQSKWEQLALELSNTEFNCLKDPRQFDYPDSVICCLHGKGLMINGIVTVVGRQVLEMASKFRAVQEAIQKSIDLFGLGSPVNPAIGSLQVPVPVVYGKLNQATTGLFFVPTTPETYVKFALPTVTVNAKTGEGFIDGCWISGKISEGGKWSPL